MASLRNRKSHSGDGECLFTEQEQSSFAASGDPSAQLIKRDSSHQQVRATVVTGGVRVPDGSSFDAEARRFSMDRRLRWVLMLGVALLVVYAFTLLLPNTLLRAAVYGAGSYDLATAAQANIALLVQQLSGQSANGLSNSHIVVGLLVALTGAGLAVTGAAYQGAFANPLATPSTLGVMSGASCGMVVYIALSAGAAGQSMGRMVLTDADVAKYTDPAGSVVPIDFAYYLIQLQGTLCSLVGALAVVALVVAISKIAGHGRLSSAALVIAGQVFAAIASAVVMLFRLFLQTTGGQTAVESLAMMQMGDFSYIGDTLDLLFMGLPILVCLAVLCFLAPKLNAVSFGDDQARSLGLRVDVVRVGMIAAGTLMTAIIVSFVGSIGFVGFLIPQLLRRVVGPDFRYLLPACALGGATFMLVVSYFYSGISDTGGGVGMVSTCLGAVVFIVSIVRRRKAPGELQ